VTESTVYSLVFFGLWMELITEFVRFQNLPGAFDDVMRFFFLLGVVLMAIHLEPNQYLSHNQQNFLLALVLSITAFLSLYVCYCYHRLCDSVFYCSRRVIVYCLVICSSVVSSFVGNYWLSFWVLLINATLMLINSLNSFRVTETVQHRMRRHKTIVEEVAEELEHEPIEGQFLERFGLLVMLAAGESVLALVIAYADQEFDQELSTYMLIYVAFAMMFIIKQQYFTTNVDLEEGHALQRSRSPGAVAFCAIHWVMFLSLLWIGVSWKLVFYTWEDSGYYMGVSVAGMMICLIFGRFTHNKYVLTSLSWLRIFPVIAVVILCCFVKIPLYYSAGSVSCLLCLYLMDVYFYNRGHEQIDENILHIFASFSQADLFQNTPRKKYRER